MGVSGAEAQSAVAQRLLGALFRHVNSWAAVWFGLIFWGSVLFATARRFWPDGPTMLQLVGALTTGTTAGLLARRRGYWL